MAKDTEEETGPEATPESQPEARVGQDRAIVCSQRPQELPFDLSAELHIRGADRVSLEYRKWLVELSHELAEKARQG